MAQWTVQHRVFAVEQYFESNKSVITVQRNFRRQFNVERHGSIPDRNTILRWVSSFHTTGSVMKKKSTGRPRTVRTPQNVDTVRASVLQSPHHSTRRRAPTLGMSRRSLQRILTCELKFHPYKIMIVQKLHERDFEQRIIFCERMLDIVGNDNAVLMMSDEAHFHLNGSVNKQNCRYWAANNPREMHEKPLHSPKVTVWCGVSKMGIVGPYFFEEDGATVTVNSERYVKMLRTFLKPRLEALGINIAEMWFQQDGATAHSSNASMNHLREMFPNHVISRFGDLHWPARSPDLSPCDFFLWGHLKFKVYCRKPRSLEDLKASIREEIAAVPQGTLTKVMENFEERLLRCMNAEGRHLSDVIFKTN